MPESKHANAPSAHKMIHTMHRAARKRSIMTFAFSVALMIGPSLQAQTMPARFGAMSRSVTAQKSDSSRTVMQVPDTAWYQKMLLDTNWRSDPAALKLHTRIESEQNRGASANQPGRTVHAIVKPRRMERRLLRLMTNDYVAAKLKESFQGGAISPKDTVLVAHAISEQNKFIQQLSSMRRLLLRQKLDPASRGGLLGLSPRNQATQYFYDGNSDRNKLLKNSLLSYTGQAAKASIFTEIAYDFFGPVRLGLGTLVSNSKPYASDTTAVADEKKADQVQRLLGGGGNASIRFGLPLIGYVTNNSLIQLRLDYSPNLNFDLPGLGLDTNVVGVNFDNGGSFLFHIDGIQKKISLFGQVRYSHISGNSLFHQNLQRGSDHGLDLWQLTGGLAFSDNVRLNFNWFLGDDYITDNFKFRVGLQLLPN